MERTDTIGTATRAGREMRLLAPAKINLHLRVGRRRDDGFHPLLSWMCTVGLFDRLTLEQEHRQECAGARDAGPAVTSTTTLTSDMPGLPCDRGNLVVRIADAWRVAQRAAAEGADRGAAAAARAPTAGADTGRATRAEVHGPSAPPPPRWPRGALRVALAKRIPVGAGLGGGSSDAARTLLALHRAWCGDSDRWSVDQLSEFAARFGSDLPFFVHAHLSGPSAACSGRGEVVRTVPRPAPSHALLVLPAVALPTTDVYRRFDELDVGGREAAAGVTDPSREPDWTRWASLGAELLLPLLVNDLEPAAFSLRPDLGELREAVERTLGRPVRMSGSGSSLFSLYDSADEAAAAAETVSSRHRVDARPVEVAPRVRDDLAE